MAATTRRKILLGAALWVALIGAASLAVTQLPAAQRIKLDLVRLELSRALFGTAPTYDAVFAGGTLIERGNGVMAQVDGRLERVGEVVRVRTDPTRRAVRATFALDRHKVGVEEWRPRSGAVAVRRSQGASFLFAVKKLLPSGRLERVKQEWAIFRTRHSRELALELQPVATELAKQALGTILDELPDALARHRREIDLLGTALQGELAGEPMSRLLAQELLPIVERHAAAPAEAIGRELWDRVPLMSFALRAAADRVLEERPVRVEERWRKFVDEEALPVLRAHQAEIESALAAIARDAAGDPELRDGLKTIAERVKNDPLVQELSRRLLRELVTENPRLEAWLRELPQDPALRACLERASAQLQEFLDPLGDLLFLDATGQGINPDLAELIRLLLLRRDAQLLHVEGNDGEPLAPGGELEGRHDG
ncbi:MAG: hypothetical protein EXS13_02820 [Planctomycetes bacterium]|nr:hypothetical protein [Planctomycetota bacterium]